MLRVPSGLALSGSDAKCIECNYRAGRLMYLMSPHEYDECVYTKTICVYVHRESESEPSLGSSLAPYDIV